MKKVRTLKGTPAAMGYSFPPEWHPHVGTWLSWPRPEGISFPDKYHTVPENMARIVREIAIRERMFINVPNGNYERLVTQQLRAHECPLGNVRFFHIRTNESWCRDHGPAFLIRRGRGRGQTAIVDWAFNAWGGKYPPWDDDDAAPTRIAGELGLPVFYPGIVMEGGAVDFNGNGTILTTKSCLLNKNRNGALGKRRIEKYLLDYYGQRQVIWLDGAIAGDDTDGHVDDLARFVDPGTIVTAVEADPRDENFKPLQENLRQLQTLKDADGRAFRIVTMPMPGVVEHQGQRLPATYVNFYFVNGALLVPTFHNHRANRVALKALQAALPNRRVVGIDCTELVWGLGTIHCLTQQQPRA